MTAENWDHDRTREGDGVPDTDAAGTPSRLGMLRPIRLTSAAVIGALVSGLVAFLQGSVELAAFSVKVGRVGFFTNWVVAATYAWRSLVALALTVLVTATLGAVVWYVGALIWNRLVGSTHTS